MSNCVACDLDASGRWNYNVLAGSTVTTFVGDALDPHGIELGGYVETGFANVIGLGAMLDVTAGAVDGSDPGEF